MMHFVIKRFCRLVLKEHNTSFKSSSNHCLAALDLEQVLSSHSIVSSSRTVRPCSLWGGRWIGHWRTTWSTVCSSAPHSRAAKEAIPHLYKQERKRPPPVPRRLSRTQVLLRKVIPGDAGVGDENAEFCGFVRPLRIALVIRPLRRTYVVVVRWTDGVVRRSQMGSGVRGGGRGRQFRAISVFRASSCC